MKVKLDLSLPIVTNVATDGQPYVDEPVYKRVALFCAKEPIQHHTLTHYIRTPLRWMRPDRNGKLVPK